MALKKGNSFVWVLLTVGFAALSAVLGFQLYSLGSNVAIATVNGEKITKEEVYQKLAAQSGKALVDSMIEEKLINQEAKKANVKAAPDEVKAEVDKIKTRFGSEMEYQAALAQAGMTPEELAERVGTQVLMKKILAPKVQDKVTDEKAREYFDKNKAEFEKPAQVKASHILVKTEDEAKAILAEIKNGGDFAALAKAKSTDPSGQNGGDLGFFSAGDMVKPFSDAAFAMNVGQVSDIVQSDFGFHIIKVTDKKAAVEAKFEEHKAQIKDNLLNQELSTLIPTWLEEIKAKANISNSLDKA